jgi:hypothetical protein
MTSYVVKKQQCPNCAKLGKDNSHDNLAVYSDLHSYCYSCGFSSYPSKTKNYGKTSEQALPEPNMLFLPEDCTTTYPTRTLNWVNKYELTQNDLLLHNVLWSESISRLIFPIYSGNGSLIAWQGRDFKVPQREKKDKWYGRGNLRDTFNILGEGNYLVLVEDIVSAIKVSRFVRAMPLYGSSIGKERFKRLYSLCEEPHKVYIWLDPDKRTEALKESKLGQLYGFKTHPIFSDKDPKEHTYKEIEGILNNG